MIRIATVLLFAMALAGCATAQAWVKPGVSVQQIKQDTLECRYEAEKATPDQKVWGMSDAIATGISQGTRVNDLTGMCMQIRGYSQAQG